MRYNKMRRRTNKGRMLNENSDGDIVKSLRDARHVASNALNGMYALGATYHSLEDTDPYEYLCMLEDARKSIEASLEIIEDAYRATADIARDIGLDGAEALKRNNARQIFKPVLKSLNDLCSDVRSNGF